MRRLMPLAFAFATLGLAMPAQAADKVRFLTSWFAEAEQGGFYEAKAEGLYEKAGLDVTIVMGGPQLNAFQLLLAGQADLVIGFDFEVLKAREKHLPFVTVAASMQNEITGFMTHDDVPGLLALKGKPILVSSAGQATYWPWLVNTYGFSPDQARPYTFNLQPFFQDKMLSQQGYLTSEPFSAEKHGEKVKFFLFSDYGYPPYGTTIVTTDDYVKNHADIVARFVKASMEGWRDYLKNPAPGNGLIKADNPKMGDEEIAYALTKLKEKRVIDGGDAEHQGIGIMTESRWKTSYDFMVMAHLLDPKTDWKAAFTTQFVKDLNVH